MQTAEILYKDNQMMIHKIANDYKDWAYTQGITYEELISIGNLAFMLAVENYKEESNTKFSTYLYKCISNNIAEEITKSNQAVDYPRYIKKYAKLVRKDNNITMAVEDLMITYGVTKKVALSIKSCLQGYIKNIGLDDVDNLERISSEDDNLNNVYFDLKLWIDTLNEKDKSIVMSKLQGKTHTEIAKEQKVSTPAITQRLGKIQKSLYHLILEREV